MNLRLPVLVVALLPACQSKVTVGGDYTLELLPHLPIDRPADTDPLDGNDLTVRVTQAGETTSYPLGPSASASWSAPDVDALQDATIGLLWTPSGRSGTPLDPDDVRAWGLSPAVSIDHDTQRLPVMVGAYGLPGQYGALGTDQISLGSAAVRLPDGDVLLFGGTGDVVLDDSDDLQRAASNAVLRLRLGEDGYTFERVGDLPPVSYDTTMERVGATATLVMADGRPQVLVAGGRSVWANPSKIQKGAFLWDPQSDTATWTGTTQSEGRFLGGAEPFPDGRVALFGGFDSQVGAEFSWQIFDPATTSFDEPSDHLTSVELGAVGAAWVNLGDAGILVCGGANKSGAGPLVPTATCGLLSPDGTVTALGHVGDAPTNLRMWSAMARLDDGRVLFTGGIDNSVGGGADNQIPAVASAWLLDPDGPTWTALPDMNHPRAMHRLIPRPDGRVLILGGLAEGTSIPVQQATPAAASCGELFDPATGTFTDLAQCDVVGDGALPLVATAPGYGAFVLSGFSPEGGGQSWGVVPLGPTP